MLHSHYSFYFTAENGYNLLLGQSQELRMNVTIINEKDSAYEAQLFVEHQPSVTYIASSKGQAICNRYNETIVACTLGNPMKRDANVKITIRFDPSKLDDSEPQLSFKVFANSTSKQTTPREKSVINVNVVKRAELSIRGWALPEQSFYGGEVRGESGMENLEDIGNVVQHTYQIYNDGPWRVPYLNVRIKWPYQVANNKEKGKWLLYLEDGVRIDGSIASGECSIEQGHQVNPLKLKRRLQQMNLAPMELIDYRSYFAKLNKSHSVLAEGSDKYSETGKPSGGSLLNRVRRDHAMVIRAERLIDKDGKKTDIVNMVNINYLCS